MSLVASMYTVEQALTLCLSIDGWILRSLQVPPLVHSNEECQLEEER